MKNIAPNILATIGRTKLVEISPRLNTGSGRILAKIESFNPGGSAKDRVAAAMIEAAEKSGALKKGATIIEPTSGNTGVGLALVSAVKGYHLILTMPETMSIERRRLAAAYGAEIVLTEAGKGMRGAIEKAESLKATIPNSIILQQFENAANPESHYRSTGPEIWHDTDGKVDALVAGVGTGGTITGTGKFLKEQNPQLRIVAVEPENSAVLSGGEPGVHKLQGIGAGFIPKNLDTSLLDEIIQVGDDDAFATARALAEKEGILAGISSGAAMRSALELSLRGDYKGKTIVVILPDTGERYLSSGLFG